MKMSAFLLVAASCLSVSVRADEAPAPQQAATPQTDLPYRVQIKNVPPRLMAWWLDPAHNLGPAPTESMEEFLKRPLTPIVPQKTDSTEKELAKAKGPFALPEGVEKIVAADTGKAIVVYGTPSGMRQLQTTIDFLDKPLRYVEVEAQLVRIDSPEEIGVGETPIRMQDRLAGTFVHSDHETILANLAAKNKAKILSESTIIGVNHFPVRFDVGILAREGANNANFEAPGDLSLQIIPKVRNEDVEMVLDIVYSYSLQVIEKINGDGNRTTMLKTGPRSAKDKLENRGVELRLKTTFNGINGATIALLGFDFREFFMENKAPASQVILLLTPHIIRRAGE